MEKTAYSAAVSGVEPFEFCSTKHAAEMIGVSHRTIHLWVKSGVLQAWRTAGGHRRISLASVNAIVGKRPEPVGNIPAARVALAGGHARKKLLILDDDSATVSLYQSTLESWGLPLEVLTASNGFDALLEIGENKPDILISDLNMRGIDGFSMVRALRSNPAYRRMAIVVISGLDYVNVSPMLLPADIPVLSKPASLPRLRGLLAAVCQAA